MTEEREGNGFLINLIDSPEHVCFFNGVAAAMQIGDGELFLMDCVSGRCISGADPRGGNRGPVPPLPPPLQLPFNKIDL